MKRKDNSISICCYSHDFYPMLNQSPCTLRRQKSVVYVTRERVVLPPRMRRVRSSSGVYCDSVRLGRLPLASSRILLCVCVYSPRVLMSRHDTHPCHVIGHFFALQRGILTRPLLGELVVSRTVRLVHVRDFRHQRIIRIRIRKQRTNTQKHL